MLDPSFMPLSEQEQELPDTSSKQSKDKFMKELKNDKSLNAQYRNALIRQEEIALQMDALLSTKKIQEVREAVNIFLTEVMSLDSKERTPNSQMLTYRRACVLSLGFVS